MRLFASLSKVEEQDDGSLKVFGIASSGTRDDAGEIITPEAMKAAIPGYLAYGAVREMHQPSAAGTALECSVDSDGMTNLVAHIVDPLAVTKVKTGVYKGLSIGGKVLKRDPKDPTTITALKLVEISLVDRPCNPEASINMWKADMADPLEQAMSATEYTPPAEDVRARAAEMAKAAGEPEKNASNYMFDAMKALRAEHVPTEIEGSQVVIDPAPDVAKVDPAAAVAEALERAAKAGKMADMDYADPKNKKYPLDTKVHIRAAWSYINMPKNQTDYSAEEVKAIKDKIVAAWKAKIDPNGPPSAEKMLAFGDLEKASAALDLIKTSLPADTLQKGLFTIARVAEKLEGLGYITQSIFAEERMEGDTESKLPQMAADAMAAMQTLLVQMISEELSEFWTDVTAGAPDFDVNILPPQMGGGEIVTLASHIMDLVKTDEVALAKAGKRNSAMDQQHIQAAHDSAMKAGAMCSPDNCPDAADKAAKAIALVEADRDRLAKALTDTAPAIDALTKRLDDQAAEIAMLKAQPLPPKTAGSQLANVTSVTKTADTAGVADEPQLSPEALAKAFAALPEADRVHLAMKAAMANPVAVRL